MIFNFITIYLTNFGQKKESYHRSLYGNLNPVIDNLSREKRLQLIDSNTKALREIHSTKNPFFCYKK